MEDCKLVPLLKPMDLWLIVNKSRKPTFRAFPLSFLVSNSYHGALEHGVRI
jgi:hypothetical protein